MNKLRFLLIILFLPFLSCNQDQENPKYIVTTKVQIKNGEIEKVLELFKDTNPKLVKNQTDWVKAVFSKNDKSNTVMVQAYWKSEKSYLNFSRSSEFQNTMKGFGQYFIGKPNIEISEILFEM